MTYNLDFEKTIKAIDLFEKNFQANYQDESLEACLQEIFGIIKEKKFSLQEFKEIESRLILFRQMFANKKQQLKEQSSNLLKAQKQLNLYITNSNIKNKK